MARRVNVWMGAYNHAMLKPTVLWGTASFLEGLIRPKPNKKEANIDEDGTVVAAGWKRKGKAVTGRSKALKDSAAYTPEFAVEVARLFVQSYAPLHAAMVVE